MIAMDELRVDPIELRMTSDHLGVAADDHAMETARHREDFADGVARWRGGASSSVLRDVAERWETRHAQRQLGVNNLGQNVTTAAQRYAATDDESGKSIGSVPVIWSI
ncbi:hypothetical protein A5630_30130 [Mycolicibacterium mucogenicum]|uniref:WXG100 family type VII secretion target n=1 Tax=Mycolicibacterium mucogenicum TaxID=56689 RepID=A0A1A3GSG7_MYCMU|nr:type VII secretion target [Mycolicibacterium mucogenicum]OBJ38326.1 hypothetical protein A5630_30130 [Mycolicibacterium mucogenicum]